MGTQADSHCNTNNSEEEYEQPEYRESRIFFAMSIVENDSFQVCFDQNWNIYLSLFVLHRLSKMYKLPFIAMKHANQECRNDCGVVIQKPFDIRRFHES